MSIYHIIPFPLILEKEPYLLIICVLLFSAMINSENSLFIMYILKEGDLIPKDFEQKNRNLFQEIYVPGTETDTIPTGLMHGR